MDFLDILSAIFIVTGAVIAFYFLISPYLSGEMKNEDRLNAHIISGDEKRELQAKTSNKARKGKLEELLKDVDKTDKNIKNPPLSIRLEQAGLKWGKQQFYYFSLAMAGAVFLLVLVLGKPIYVALGGAILGGLGIPRFYLNSKKKSRIKAFIHELPNATDIIVRAVKAGLPINDAIRIVANEAKEPVKGEFMYLVELQQLGLSLAEAVVKLPQRMPIPEANFFALAIVIQQKAGGSISEILGNLSKVLRERKKLKQKVISLSQEAKSSAAIVGSIPFVLATFLAVFQPNHMLPLFNTNMGNVMLLCCAGIMAFGIFIMNKMINFEV